MRRYNNPREVSSRASTFPGHFPFLLFDCVNLSTVSLSRPLFVRVSRYRTKPSCRCASCYLCVGKSVSSLLCSRNPLIPRSSTRSACSGSAVKLRPSYLPTFTFISRTHRRAVPRATPEVSGSLTHTSSNSV